MKILIAQINVIAGDPKTNFLSIKKIIDEANGEYDLIAFGEMCISGYLIGDEWNCNDQAEWFESYNDKIMELSSPTERNPQKPVTIIWGNIAIDKSKKNEDGRIRKYNAAWVASNGKYIERELFGKKLPFYQAKTLMPNYRFFDDKRYFSSFEKYIEEDLFEKSSGYDSMSFFVPFEIMSYSEKKTYKVGVEVCEDMWHSDYNMNPTQGYAEREADFIVNVSASPWTWEKEKARANVVKKLFHKLKEKDLKLPPIYYANIVGAQNNGKNIITFDGRSSVYNSDGDLVSESNELFTQSIFSVNFPIDKNKISIKREESGPEEFFRMREKFLAIKTGLKHICNGITNKWVIGLSGGIDSCVSASILVSTFGKDNVIGVNMPSQYNSDKTKNVAKKLAENLGIKYYVVPIESSILAKRKALKSYNKAYGAMISGRIDEENEQARMRGMILADIAAFEGAFFINNGNKIETATGYATMYGDIAGAVAPLADLTKEEVYEMARYVNGIPVEVIVNKDFSYDDKIRPSAELNTNQVDPFKFGFICRLVENGIMNYNASGINTILNSWLNRTIIEDFKLDKKLFYKYDLHKGHVFVSEILWFFRKMKNSTFKRVQSPPIIVTSKSSFGYDFRESILPFAISSYTNSLFEKIKNQEFY